MRTNRKIAEPMVAITGGEGLEGDYLKAALDMLPMQRMIKQQDVVVISFTQLKVHSEATASMSIKNIALGWPPAEEHGFPKKRLGIQEDLHSFIFAMGEKIPIDLAIISTDKAMIGVGPSGG